LFPCDLSVAGLDYAFTSALVTSFYELLILFYKLHVNSLTNYL